MFKYYESNHFYTDHHENTFLSLSLPFTCIFTVKTFKNENIHRLSWLFSWRTCSKLHLKNALLFFFARRETSFNAQCPPCANCSSRFWILESVEIHMTSCVCVCCLKRFSILVIEQFTTTERQEASTTTTGPLFPKPDGPWIRVSPFPVWNNKQYLSLPTPSQSGNHLTCQRVTIYWWRICWDVPGRFANHWITLFRCCLPRGWSQDWWCLYSSAMPGAAEVQRQLRGDVRSLLAKGNPGHCHSSQKYSPPDYSCWQRAR